MLEWERKSPILIGMYLFKENGRWPIHVKVKDVHVGEWAHAQNPEWIYADNTPVQEMEGQWYGPIPDLID